MAYNKIITSEGNVQFQTADGNIINVHPFHIYTTFNEDTVSFILIAMPKYSGLAIFTSKASDLEVDGTVYTIEQLPNALSEAFAKAGAVARYEIVDELPTSGQSNTIYLVPKEEGVGYDEYIYVNGEWELIGDTDVEFDKYLTKEAFSAYSAATELKIDGKVVELTQAEYDAMVSGGTIDPLVLYVITDAVEVNMADYYKKVETSGATELSTAFANEASARTDADNAISAATSGKLDTSIFETYSGNVETALDAKVNTSDFNTYSASTQTAINGKQDTLVSGTNIKTINNESILGEGNIDIQGGGKAIAAGTNISVTTGETADTINCTLPMFAGHKNMNSTAIAFNINTNIGAPNHKNGENSLSYGYFGRAYGQNSFAGGNYVSSENSNEFSVGTYNVSNTGSTTADKTLFSIGNGTANNARHNAFEIRQNGDIYLTKDGQDVKLQDQLGGSSITVDTALDSGSTNPVENRVIYNKIDEVEQVTAAGLNALNDKFDGLKLKKLTQAEYDALVTKDANTLYIVI